MPNVPHCTLAIAVVGLFDSNQRALEHERNAAKREGMKRSSHCLGACFAALLLTSVAGCGSDGEEACSSSVERPIAVLSAFPAEMAAVLAHATKVRLVEHGGRRSRLAQIGRHAVVVGMTGMGLVNARQGASDIVEQFPVRGLLVAGVAGSASVPIGSVVVPQRWQLRTGQEFPVHPAWWELVQELSLRRSPPLLQCTSLTSSGGSTSVCMPNLPRLLTANLGLSDDPFAGRAFPCQERGNDLYGCDLPGNGSSHAVTAWAADPRRARTREPVVPAITDMETAAIAQVATERGVPFVAVRAVSDGPGDPLRLPSFLEQFSTYYRYAAANAALAAEAFLQLLPCER